MNIQQGAFTPFKQKVKGIDEIRGQASPAALQVTWSNMHWRLRCARPRLGAARAANMNKGQRLPSRGLEFHLGDRRLHRKLFYTKPQNLTSNLKKAAERDGEDDKSTVSRGMSSLEMRVTCAEA